MKSEMPHNSEVEYKMIAVLLYYPELLKRLTLKEDHFYILTTRLAYQVLSQMQVEGEAVDLITFSHRYYDKGGRVSEISSLFTVDSFQFSFGHAETYLKILAEELVKRKIMQKYENFKDAPLDFIEEVKALELEFISPTKAKDLTELYDEYVTEYAERKERLKSGGSVGLITGFKYIDENCPFDKGDFIILAAKTSTGKTALALNIAINCAMYNQRVLFFSAEMTARALQDRIYAQLTKTAATSFKYCNADHSLRQAAIEIKDRGKNFKIIEAGRMTSNDICRLVRREAVELPPDLIVVDYLQYLRDPVGKGMTNNDRVGQITRNLHALAQELKCSILGLSQVNRATTGEPELHNLRDSGNLEQDSEIVLFLYRESREDTTAKLIIAKNRNGKLVQPGELRFDPNLTKFYE